MTEKIEEETEDEGPIIESEGAIETLNFAATGLVDIYAAIPDEDLADTTVTVNAERMAECLEMLLCYAEAYENVIVEDLIDQAEIERQMGSYSYGSSSIH